LDVVVIITDAPSLPPTEVEQLVTYPIEQGMLGLPHKEEVRSLTHDTYQPGHVQELEIHVAPVRGVVV
jgi:Cu/Ag efflux pump CusA